MPFLSYYYFRFIGRHCYFRLSADIDDGTVETAVPEHKGVADEISFLSGRGVKLEGVADLPPLLPLHPLSALQNPVRCPRVKLKINTLIILRCTSTAEENTSDNVITSIT